MVVSLLILALLTSAPDGEPVPAAGDSAATTDSVSAAPIAAPRAATPDSAALLPRVARVFEEIVVRAPLHDLYSSESVHLVTRQTLLRLPIDDLAGAFAAKAGVVAQAGDLHVRGGRAGDVQMLLGGVPLNEPRRGRPMEVPFLALESADLVSGALEAQYGGALAGVVTLRTIDPTPRPEAELRWQTDGGADTRYDRIGARASGPLFATGLGAVVSAEASLDDTHLPSLRSEGRHDLLGGAFGWRADNRLLGQMKLTTLSAGSRVSLEVLGSRIVNQPFDPMWSLDGYTKPSGDPLAGEFGPQFRPEPTPGFTRYRAADHLAVTDDRRLAAVLSWMRPWRSQRTTVALGWVADRRLVSVGGRDDESYLAIEHAPIFGITEWPTSQPFYIYQGDEPFFQRSTGSVLSLRADHAITRRSGSGAQFGLGGDYTGVSLRELDVSTRGLALDSLRTYRAWAPGAFAYAQGRWVFEGLVLNAGLRGELFTAGPQADDQSLDVPTHAIATLSPRLGIAFPISVRDVFSLAYVRIQQNPARDFLYDNRLRISNRQPLGNPALEPATVISYQAAVKHVIDERWAAQTAVFYRDLFGQIGQRSQDVSAGVQRPVYLNADEGHAAGFEVSLLRGADERGLLELHYTYLQAWGTQSLEEGMPFGAQIGARPGAIGEHPLDWDRRHTIVLAAERRASSWSYGWITAFGSGLPWTPRARRELDADLSLVNSERFKWDETTSFSVHWLPSWLGGRSSLGFDVRNLFDHRSEIAATVDGYPQPDINTVYDDYGAYRTETGHSGGAYWNDLDGDGRPGWIAVHDPRLFQVPRSVRLSIGTTF